MKLQTYSGYAEYRQAQIEANINKQSVVWVYEKDIEQICRYLKSHNRNPRAYGMCHGTRNGKEILYFKKHYKGCNVLGTEISPLAQNYDNTIEWDFHELKPEWKNNFYFVYSNSWDHAYNPEKAFKNWSASIQIGGYLVLEHTNQHTPDRCSESDCFGCELDELKQMLADWCPELELDKVLKSLCGRREGSILIYKKVRE